MKVCPLWFIECKAYVLQVYIPAIVGYVPDQIVMCLSAFLDACYIVQQQVINANALDTLGTVLVL